MASSHANGQLLLKQTKTVINVRNCLCIKIEIAINCQEWKKYS